MYRLNSFTKSLLKIKGNQRDAFFQTIHKHEDVVWKAKDNMKPINKWIVSHEKLVKCVPHVIYAFVKLFKIA